MSQSNASRARARSGVAVRAVGDVTYRAHAAMSLRLGVSFAALSSASAHVVARTIRDGRRHG